MKRQSIVIWAKLVLGFLMALGACIALANATPSAAAPQASPGWIREQVDTADDVGRLSSLQVDGQNQTHVAYFDATHVTLKYAYQRGASWTVSTVAALSRPLGSISLALDSQGRPHVAYSDGQAIYYAYHNGKVWTTALAYQQAGYPVGYVSLALDSGDQPRLSWYRGSPPSHMAGVLMYGERVKEQWRPTLVDASAIVGMFSSIAVDSQGQPHISYYDITHQDLKYAYRDTRGSWHTATVDQLGDVGRNSSLALDSRGQPHISYRQVRDDNDRGNLKYARQKKGQWLLEIVQNTGDVSDQTSIALSATDLPAIGFFRYLIGPHWQIGRAMFARYDGSAWQYHVVDDAGDVGYDISLGLDTADQPHLSYYDATNADLKVAFQPPLRFYRLAMDHIQSVQGTDMAPGWEHAFLGDPVTPIYRPDVQGVAYYEFPVYTPVVGAAADAAAGPQAAGFIIVATGDHDYPIPHWDFRGGTITDGLRHKAAEQKKTASKFYKIDALAYAAEDASGELAAVNWQLPPKATGMNAEWLKSPPSFETLWTPDSPAQDDSGVGELKGTLVVSGTLQVPSGLSLSGWGSWQELKSEYSQSYGVLMQHLRGQARMAWQAQDSMAEGGNILHKGDVELIPLLWSYSSVTMSGAGMNYVKTEIRPDDTFPGIYVIHVVDAVPGQALPLTVTIEYNLGVHEVRQYLIVDNLLTWLPLVRTGWQALPGSASARTTTPAAPANVNGAPPGFHWTSWTRYWAGTDNDQRWYDQIHPHTPPNTDKCWSGCGPTAWGMLFGWADYQAAHGNAYWAGRWGLYRVGGGHGGDAVAPGTMDDGVKNMVWEVNQDVDTFCLWSATESTWLGGTWASDMDDARDYLSGRSYTRLYTWGNDASIPWHTYREHAVDAIRYRGTPVVIGIGAWEHYPLAYGYGQRELKDAFGTTWYTKRQFYVNQGWGVAEGKTLGDHGWVTGNIWFAGEIRPYAPPTTNEIDDLVLYSTSDHKWRYDYGHNGDTNAVSKAWGKNAGNLPIAGDFDRDGFVDDVAVYRPDHEWHYDYDHNGSTDEHHGPWGWTGDLPMAGDFDRDGFVDDVAVYRPSTHIWYYDYDHNGNTDATSGPWGWAEDRPFSGDFDQDGFWDDVAVYRPSTHDGYYDYNHNGSTDEHNHHWGLETGIPVAADFDGDGFVDDIAIFIPDWAPEAIWFIDYDHDGPPNTAITWGGENDLPAAGAFGDDQDR